MQFKLYYIYINNKKKNRTEASIPQMLFIKFYVQHSKFKSSNMRIVIQRVSHASVTIEGEVKSAIRQGYLILLGIEESDTSEDVDWLVRKVIGLRVFDDENHVMNRSIMDIMVRFWSSASSPYSPATRKETAQAGSEQPSTKSAFHSMRSSAKAIRCTRKASRSRRIWCRYEGRFTERWTGNHHDGYSQQGIMPYPERKASFPIKELGR